MRYLLVPTLVLGLVVSAAARADDDPPTAICGFTFVPMEICSDLNDQGWVLGRDQVGGLWRAKIWGGSTLVTIQDNDVTFVPNALNNNGTMVGIAQVGGAGIDGFRAELDGTWTVIEPSPVDINDAGKILHGVIQSDVCCGGPCGRSDYFLDGGLLSHLYETCDESEDNLVAYFVNESDDVVGFDTNSEGVDVGCLWTAGGGPLEVLPFGSVRSEMISLNDRGDVVGTHFTLRGKTRGFAFLEGLEIDLEDFIPIDINDKRWIIGYDNSVQAHILRMPDGTMHDLATLVGADWVGATRINDNGQILALLQSGASFGWARLTTGCVSNEWGNPAGGSYHEPTNWLLGSVPDEDATAVFDLDCQYTVTLDQATQQGGMVIGQDDVTMQLDGWTLQTLNMAINPPAAGFAKLALESSAAGGTVIVDEAFVMGLQPDCSTRLDVGMDVTLEFHEGLSGFRAGAADGALAEVFVQGTFASEGAVKASVFGAVPGATGRLTVGGSDAVTLFSQLVVGGEGTGAVTISDGGVLHAAVAWLGLEPTGSGQIDVTNGQLQLPEGGHLAVGLWGQGTVDVAPAGTLTVPTSAGITIGQELGGIGVLTVSGTIDGANTTLLVGKSGQGTFEYSGALPLTYAVLRLGENLSGDGTLTVRAGATIQEEPDSIADLVIGVRGAGTVNVLEGSTVTTNISDELSLKYPEIHLGKESGSAGTLNVAGNGAHSLAESAGIEVGRDGLGTLSVTGSATVRVDHPDFEPPWVSFKIGVEFNGFGIATISEGGTLDIEESAIVGVDGDGELHVTTAGHVDIAGDLTVGFTADVFQTPSRVLVSGSGSTLGVAGATQIGNDGGSACLEVRDGGTLTTQDLTVGTGLSDVLVIGAGATWVGRDVWVTEGNLCVGSGATVTLSSCTPVSGAVTVGRGGTLTVAVGDSPSPGQWGLTTAELTVQPGAIVTADAITINGGTLGGTGTLEFDVTSDGVIDPGVGACGIGTFTIDGQYVQEPAGTLVIEMTGTIPDSEHDVLSVSGDATLSGTLRIEPCGYLPQNSDEIAILTAGGTVTGAFDAIEACADVEVTVLGGVVTVRFLADCVPTCDEDLDGDGIVGFGDLLSVLSNWGPCVGCPEDIDGDLVVGFSDLLLVLSSWGPCA